MSVLWIAALATLAAAGARALLTILAGLTAIYSRNERRRTAARYVLKILHAENKR